MTSPLSKQLILVLVFNTTLKSSIIRLSLINVAHSSLWPQNKFKISHTTKQQIHGHVASCFICFFQEIIPIIPNFQLEPNLLIATLMYHIKNQRMLHPLLEIYSRDCCVMTHIEDTLLCKHFLIHGLLVDTMTQSQWV